MLHIWQLSSFPESESWSGAKSEANSRKPGNIPGLFPGIPGVFQVYPQNTGYFADLADFGPKPASLRLGSEPKNDDFHGVFSGK